MQARIGAELGVEGEGGLVLPAGGDDVAVDGGEDVYVRRGLCDIGGADEGHREVTEAL